MIYHQTQTKILNMGLLFFLIGIPVIIGGVVSFIIAKKVHDSLMIKGNPNYVGISVATFIGCFLAIGGLLFFLIVSNINFGR